MAMPELVPADRKTLLSDSKLRSDLMRFVRGRVSEAEAEDVVQTTLTDALAAREVPSDPEELRRWVFGIAKNKVVDHHRRGFREVTREAPVGDEASAESAPLSARDLLRWAEKELPEGDGAQSTLEWMLREGAGEKLEHIAEDEKLPPARVRQRVSRLRRYYRARWTAQLAAAAALLVLALAVWAIWRGRATPGPDDIARELPSVEQRAGELRRAALERCGKKDWQGCLDGLDRAKALDPQGDDSATVRDAREAIGRALSPKSAPEPTSVPTGKTAPTASSAPQVPAPPVKPTSGPPPVQKDAPPTDIKKMAPQAPTQSSESLAPKSKAPSKGQSKANSDLSDFPPAK